MAGIKQLYDTLQQRKRPEDVADMIIELIHDDLSYSERATLEKAAKGSLSRNVYGYTSMLETFAAVVGAEKQVRKAIEIFKPDITMLPDGTKYDQLEAFIRSVTTIIHKPYGQNDFTTARLNKTQRKAQGLDLSKRSYNKKWRMLKRLEDKLVKLAREDRKLEFQKIAKHGLAHQLDFTTFSADIGTTCFIAYYNARCNVRSVFTNGSQDRAFDEICDMLLRRCNGKQSSVLKYIKPKTQKTDHTNWWAVSFIYTSDEVLKQLTDEQKGLLLGKRTTVLQDIARLLAELWHSGNINRETMIVKKGNDSTTWNNTAGAWNKARDHWMYLIYGLGLDTILPWEVFGNEAYCNKEMVAQCCSAAGLDPERSGWIAPRAHGISEYRPTPELVHGVMVANPFLATVLKKNNYFSGKPG